MPVKPVSIQKDSFLVGFKSLHNRGHDNQGCGVGMGVALNLFLKELKSESELDLLLNLGIGVGIFIDFLYRPAIKIHIWRIWHK